MALPRATSGREVDVLAVSVRWSRRLVLGTVVLAVLATGLPEPAHDVVVFVLVGAGLLAGLPHGAIDHRVAADLTGWPAPVVAVVYAAVAAVTWVLLETVGRRCWCPCCC